MKLPFDLFWAFDTETDLIGKGNVIPDMVCLTYAVQPGEAVLLTCADSEIEELEQTLVSMLTNDRVAIVGHELAYDLCVAAKRFPHILPLIFAAGRAGRLFDTKINDKLLRLSTIGFLDDVRYSLADISLRRLKKDRSVEKSDPDSWRLRYRELAGVPSAQYPQAASRYAREDAEDTFAIFHQQIAEATEAGHGSMNTAALRAAVSFCLKLYTAHGLHTDLDRVAQLEQSLHKVLNDDNLAILYESGILRRGQEPRILNFKAVERGEEPRWTKGKAPSINKAKLQALVEQVSIEQDTPIVYTDPSSKFPEGQVSTANEVLQELAGADPVLDKYIEREEVLKIQTTYLPNLQEGIVYPNYDVLKATGRSSSFKGERTKQLYPSTNIQNQPRLSGELSVRETYVARPGWLICSNDYGSLELCSFAQVVYWLFGYSSLRDQINAGYSPHSFFGAQLCYHLYEPFRACLPHGANADEIYHFFLEFKKVDSEQFKFYRTLAKPTGLGYPGGLGPRKFRAYAKSTYGVEVTLEEATQLRDLWFFIYPEHKQYLQHINSMEDPQNIGFFCYSTPMQMFRAGATYCAAANGWGLQSPSAEGAFGAVWESTQAMYDWTQESILFGCRPLAFIHDEILMELPDDGLAHERAFELAEIMKKSMQRVLPDVTITAEPALMRRWYKEAEPSYDESGRLIPWEPENH